MLEGRYLLPARQAGQPCEHFLIAAIAPEPFPGKALDLDGVEMAVGGRITPGRIVGLHGTSARRADRSSEKRQRICARRMGCRRHKERAFSVFDDHRAAMMSAPAPIIADALAKSSLRPDAGSGET